MGGRNYCNKNQVSADALHDRDVLLNVIRPMKYGRFSKQATDQINNQSPCNTCRKVDCELKKLPFKIHRCFLYE